MLVKQRVGVLDPSAQTDNLDRSTFGQKLSVANAAGGGAGLNVATVVTFTEPLPASYQVVVGTSQDCVAYVTARTTFGFTVNLTPRLAASTLASGTFDVTVLAV